MHTVCGTSIIRPTRSMASPAVTAASSCCGPTQVHAATGGLPSEVVIPTTVFQTGGSGPLVSGVTLKNWTLPFESTIALGLLNVVFGRHPAGSIVPMLLQAMLVPSATAA